VRKRRPGQGHRAEHVGVELALDLLVGGFLGGADQRVPSIGDDDVDPAERGEGVVDDPAYLRGPADVELSAPICG
jgi:hypothetical protein